MPVTTINLISQEPPHITPGAPLGVLGGGQLGRMFVHAAQQMGFFTVVLDADESSPAGCVSDYHIRANYMDPDALHELSQLCSAVTTEFENVPAQALEQLSQQVFVSPQAGSVEICQDRASEKALFRRSGIPCAPHKVIHNAADIAAADQKLFPAILKTARMGYDGKGQVCVGSLAELPFAWQTLNKASCILEKKLPLIYEISVVVARGYDGQCINFPVQRNLHRNGILAVTEVSWDTEWLPQELQNQAIEAAKELANYMQYVGVMCVEFFVLENNILVANEIAPRPHNSGHWTIDGCYCSQFEAQVRTMTGMPLVDPGQHSSAVMLNLLGDLWYDGDDKMTPPAWEHILALPGAHLHLYGKKQVRKERKMGHLTITATRLVNAKDTALQAAELLGIPLW